MGLQTISERGASWGIDIAWACKRRFAPNLDPSGSLRRGWIRSCVFARVMCAAMFHPVNQCPVAVHDLTVSCLIFFFSVFGQLAARRI